MRHVGSAGWSRIEHDGLYNAVQGGAFLACSFAG